MAALSHTIRTNKSPMTTDFVAFEPAPPHPGEILREEFMPRLSLTEGQLARHLGLPEETLRSLIVEKAAIDLDIARRLGKAFGTGPRYWLALQMHHDVFIAEQSSDIAVAPLCGKDEARRNRLDARQRPSMAGAISAALGK